MLLVFFMNEIRISLQHRHFPQACHLDCQDLGEIPHLHTARVNEHYAGEVAKKIHPQPMGRDQGCFPASSQSLFPFLG